MIISLSEKPHHFKIPTLPDLDVLCFFKADEGISCDESLWWDSLCSSLRMKRSVLILESNISEFPTWDPSKRFQASDNWCWLAPRGLSVISAAYKNSPMLYPEFKTFLKNSK